MNNANVKWLSIPSSKRGRLVDNVWCTNCSDTVKITNYVIHDHDLGTILDGKCGNGGNNVSRVIEM